MIFEKIRERLQERILFHQELSSYEQKCGTITEEFQQRKAVEVLENAIDIIDQVEAEYNNGWISVDDRLPDDFEDVLVWFRGKFKDGVNIGEECLWYGIGYILKNKWAVFRCKDVKGVEVIAWQPLPKPPKGE